MTEEEKKARLAEMRSKVAEKKAAQAAKDKEDAKANEVRLSTCSCPVMHVTS